MPSSGPLSKPPSLLGLRPIDRTGLNPLGWGLMYRCPGPSPAIECMALWSGSMCVNVKGKFCLKHGLRKAEEQSLVEQGGDAGRNKDHVAPAFQCNPPFGLGKYKGGAMGLGGEGRHGATGALR